MSIHPALKPGIGLLADTTRANLIVAWIERFEEAEALLSGGHRSMGLALKTYAFEVRLKLQICEHLGLEHLPIACKTHELNELLVFTGLWAELREGANQPILDSWNAVAQFSKDHLNRLRYASRSDIPEDDIKKCLLALDDPNRGVFAWLARSR